MGRCFPVREKLGNFGQTGKVGENHTKYRRNENISDKFSDISGFPLGLENLEKWEGNFPVREKSGNFDQTGKVRENHTKYWKTEGISDKYYVILQ